MQGRGSGSDLSTAFVPPGVTLLAITISRTSCSHTICQKLFTVLDSGLCRGEGGKNTGEISEKMEKDTEQLLMHDRSFDCSDTATVRMGTQ